MKKFGLLAEICETPGAPGYEQRIRELIIEKVSPFVDEVTADAMGNLIVLKRGTGTQRLMVAAHMDEISFIVTHIEEEGFVRFHTLGGFDPKTLTAQRVVIHGKKDIIGVMGSKPIHLMKPSEQTKAPRITDYFIDTGRPAREVKKLVSVGDVITRERKLIRMGPCVNGKSLDNRVSVFILIEALRKLGKQKPPLDVYGVFTVQEEVGLRGATTSASQINPHYGLGLDVTIAFDVPGAQPHEMITRMGAGAAIKIMDGSTICDYRMVNYLKWLARKKKIRWQTEVLTAGGTDTAAIQRAGRDGAIAGAISIPLRHIHQSIEMAHEDDIAAAINLLTNSFLYIDKFDWSL